MPGPAPAMTIYLIRLRHYLPRQPFRDAFLRIDARLGIGADMAALRRRGIAGPGNRVRRQIGAVELLIGAEINYDSRHRAAPARAVNQLAADAGRTEVVLCPDPF